MNRKEFITKSAGSLAALTVLNLLKVDGKSFATNNASKIFYRKFQETKGTQIIIRKFYFTIPTSVDKTLTSIDMKIEVYDKGDEEKSSMQIAHFEIPIKKSSKEIMVDSIGRELYLKCGKYKLQSGSNLLFDCELEPLQKNKSEITVFLVEEKNRIEIRQKGKWIMTLDEFDPEASDKDDECYLTTICVQHLYKPDQCAELATLRNFRDHYIRNLPNGEALVQGYYSVAPKVVARIKKSSKKTEILDAMYQDLVLPTLALIHDNKLQSAQEYYTSYALTLHNAMSDS